MNLTYNSIIDTLISTKSLSFGINIIPQECFLINQDSRTAGAAIKTVRIIESDRKMAGKCDRPQRPSEGKGSTKGVEDDWE